MTFWRRASQVEEQQRQQEHNDKLIDLCYRAAIQVCAKAEGFHGFHDWDLPSNKEFRHIVRAQRHENYREPPRRSPLP